MLEFVAGVLPEELYVEMMEGLEYRRWVPVRLGLIRAVEAGWWLMALIAAKNEHA